jgi:hypothetical protein
LVYLPDIEMPHTSDTLIEAALQMVAVVPVFSK